MMSPNKKLVKQLATLRKLMDKADEITATLAPVTKKIEAAREEILNDFTEAEMQSTTAGGLRASRVITTVPSLVDKKKFFAFATRPKNWDLLSNSVNPAAWRERLEAKVKVPGVDVFNRVGLRVLRLGEK